MTPHTQTLMDVTLQTGALNGGWFSPRAGNKQGVENITIAFSLAAGTFTADIEGRNSPSDDPVKVATGINADNGALRALYPEMRIVLTAAAGATLKVTAGVPCKPL